MEERVQIKQKTPAASKPFPARLFIERSRSAIDVDSTWLITLSDVLSLLLIFFVMFLVIGKTNVKPATAEASQNPSTRAPITGSQTTISSARDTIVQEMNSEIKKLDLGNDVSVQTLDKTIVITLKEKVTFRPGEAETLKRSEVILDNIAHIIQRYDSFLVDIEGHTDNVPIRTRFYPSNWELSVARATSVLKYFIKHHNIDPSRLTIKGNADQKPVASNDTPENRARNRRVEIRLRGEES